MTTSVLTRIPGAPNWTLALLVVAILGAGAVLGWLAMGDDR